MTVVVAHYFGLQLYPPLCHKKKEPDLTSKHQHTHVTKDMAQPQLQHTT